MRKSGITARRKKKYKAATDSSHGEPVAKNVLNRRFTVESPNTVWAGDIKVYVGYSRMNRRRGK